MHSANRVVKNTFILYAQKGITLFLSLYITRLVLAALGTDDFGIFSLVGGAITLLIFLNAAMASASQRFMSFYAGTGNTLKQTSIFNISVLLHFFIGIILVIILEGVGYLLFEYIFTIEPNRIYEAKLIFQFLIISTFFNIISVPYDAVINAHENMTFVGVIGIIETLLKLFVALYITYTTYDKLVSYGLLMASLTIVLLIIRRIYCHLKYEEVTINIRKYFDRQMFKEMKSFASWSLLGSSSSIIAQYGQGIVINMFFGTSMNAAQGVAGQVSGQLGVFSSIMMKALNPVLAKSEGSNNRNLMLKASMIGSKFSFFLLVLFFVPIMIDMPFVFNLWLKEVPEYAIIFCRLLLLRNLIEQLFATLGSSIAAVGDIKQYQIISSVLNYLPLLITYLFFHLDYEPQIMYIVFLCYVIAKGFLNMYYSQEKCDLSISLFFKDVIIPCLIVFGLNYLVSFVPLLIMEESFTRFILIAFLSVLSFLVFVWVFGLQKNEKVLISNVFIAVKKKMKL